MTMSNNLVVERLAASLAEAVIAGKASQAECVRRELTRTLAHAAVTPALHLRTLDRRDLPERPGVYVISSTRGSGHYVGLAFDIRHRFLNPLYGHLTRNNKSRSSKLVADGAFEIRVARLFDQEPGRAARDPETRFSLSKLEIQTYADLVMSGARALNTVGLLGRVGQSPGSPVLLCAYSSDEYVYCDSLIEAVRFARSNAVPAVVYGYQRTAVGFGARWATIAEAEALTEEVDDAGVVRGRRVAAVAGAEATWAHWSGIDRGAHFEWRAGTLTSADLARLKLCARDRYSKSAPSSRFNGVSWHRHLNGWQCRAKSGPGPKELWQTTRRHWVDDLDAADFRERKILLEGWQAFNQGRCASNAESINRLVGEARYQAW